MVNHLNLTGGYHIVIIEDPIEYVHPSINSAMTLRELGKHTHSYSAALKHVLRQNPDVILVGEIRDFDAAAAILSVAETGHLVLTTSHAPSAPQAIERIVDMFPPHERRLSETRLASLLVVVICQILVPRADGSGRVAAVEIMVANTPVRNLIRDGKIHLLSNVIQTHGDIGMVSLDESLAELYRKGTITYETAEAFCRDVDQLYQLIYRTAPAKTSKHG
jgi:twitching motility protein PilT